MIIELTSEAVGAPIGEASVWTPSNKRMPARATLADGDLACNIAVLKTPAAGTYVSVSVNGLSVSEVGDRTRAGAWCYFSGDGGATARAWSDIRYGDTLHWQGSIAGYQLTPGDEIDLFYEERS